MPQLNELKRYAVLDPSDGDDLLLEACMEAAVEWFQGAGVAPRESRLYDLGVYMLAVHYFDNRGVVGKDEQLPMGVYSIMHQLRL